MAKISSDVIRLLMNSKGVTRQQLAAAFNITIPGIANKFSRGSFDCNDLMLVASACGVRLAFVDNKNNVVVSFPAPDLAETNND